MVLTQDDRATIAFTNEKDFILEIVKNNQNNHGYGPSNKADIAQIGFTTNPKDSLKKVWYLLEFLGGKTYIQFIDTQRGKVNSETYSICSMNIYYQTARPCIPKTTTYSNRMALHLIPAEPVRII